MMFFLFPFAVMLAGAFLLKGPSRAIALCVVVTGFSCLAMGFAAGRVSNQPDIRPYNPYCADGGYDMSDCGGMANTYRG